MPFRIVAVGNNGDSRWKLIYIKTTMGKCRCFMLSGDKVEFLVGDGAQRIPPFKLPNISSGHHKMKVTGPGINKTIDVLVKENGKTFVDLDSKIYK